MALLTVKELSKLANVTIKTLHHYHKIGLLLPSEISNAGYRLYGVKELERLQEILFYRELDFSLNEIKNLLDGSSRRLSILLNQRNLLLARKQRLEYLIQTIDESIEFTSKGEIMDQSAMFKGFANEKEWENALEEQQVYLKETYDYDLIESNSIKVEEMNKQAVEAKRFVDKMSISLQSGIRFDDSKIQGMIKQHIEFLNQNGHKMTAEDFADQTRFFLEDDFHREMLEKQQTGLAYYLCIAAEVLTK